MTKSGSIREKKLLLQKKKMANPVIIIGANAVGRVAASVLSAQGLVVYGFLDDNEKLQGSDLDNVAVLGKTDESKFLKLIGKKCDVFFASEEAKVRKFYFEKFENEQIYPINIIDKSAFIASGVILGHGLLIQAGAVISAGADLSNCINIGAGAVVEAQTCLKDCVNIGSGAVVGEGVVLEESVFVGAGAVIVSGIKVEKNARVGAGSVVIENVGKGKTVFGNPAKNFS